MKKLEIKAYSLEEAKEKSLQQGIEVVQNVTKSWEKAGEPKNEIALRQFAADQLERLRLGNNESLGIMIVMDKGVKNTLKFPYKIHNKVTDGKRTTKRVVEIRLKSNDKLVGEADSKKLALEVAKELMNEYQEDMYATVVYRVQGGQDVVFEMEYVLSSKANEGTYLVYANEKYNF